MTISMFDSSVPTLIHFFGQFKEVLKKAEEHAKNKECESANLCGSRLIADMHPLTKQIQIASDISKIGMAKLAGVDAPSFADDEQSFPELYARIDKTVEFLNTLTAEQINGTEEKEITMNIRGNELKLSGQKYLVYFIMPNFYFHYTTAYDILRANGVALGKFDFIGNIFA